tara:strand:+ start:1109 stop:1264 length:156 start_codon:yes stop_codon:yes gene_type:complete
VRLKELIKFRVVDFDGNHDFNLDKKGFKKPLPWIILLIIMIFLSALIYLDS